MYGSLSAKLHLRRNIHWKNSQAINNNEYKNEYHEID